MSKSSAMPKWAENLGVEHAFALCYTGYPERIGPFMDEVARAGLSGATDRIYTYANPFDAVLLRHAAHVNRKPGHFNAMFGHYAAVKTALAMGWGRILVMEDDCRFLNDLSALEEASARVPADWDMLALDAFVWKGENKSPWTPCPFWRSGAAICVGTKAMTRLRDEIEASIGPGANRHPLRNYDGFFDSGIIGRDLRMYRAWPNLAVQCSVPGASLSDVAGKYAELGVDVSRYAPFRTEAAQ